MSFPNPDGQKKLDEMSTKLKEHLSDERIDLLRRYFEAANNFYQIITLKRLFRIINSQNSETYTEDDFLAYAEITRHERHYFEIYGLDEIFERQPESTPINRLLLHESLLEYNDYVELYSEKQGRAYYVPEKEVLLKYEDEFYCEQTPQFLAMREFCTKNAKKSDDEVIEDLLFAILFNVKCEHSSPFDALEFINKFSVQLDVNKKKFPEFIRLYCELHNNTRNPFLNGFTPNEWLQRTGDETDSRYLDPKDF